MIQNENVTVVVIDVKKNNWMHFEKCHNVDKFVIMCKDEDVFPF